MEVFQQSKGLKNGKRNTHARSILLRDVSSESGDDFAIRWFPKFFFNLPTSLHPLSSKAHSPRQSTSTVPDVLASFTSLGPFLSRLVAQGSLASPLFTVTLQRDSIDVGGNAGMLAIGGLPAGVNNDSLTWVQVRGYPSSAGGLTAPADSPNELYPVTWEIPLDDVYFDGQKLPRSSLSPSGISLSALIDTVSRYGKPSSDPRLLIVLQGNSLIRGPPDVIQSITNTLGGNGNFPCADAHSLAFQIGGKMFPVDPRDFVQQAFQGSVDVCTSTFAATDPPRGGTGFLYSWSLGDPFLKS
jgi:phytepsin